MARQQATKVKRSGNGSRPRSTPKRAPRPVPSLSESTVPVVRTQNGNGKQFNATQFRFHFASLLRLSDNLVAKAVAVYDRLFALDQREQTEIYMQMGQELVREHKFDEALVALRKVLASRPEHGDALLEVGLIHLKRGAPHAAVEVLRKAKDTGMRSHKLHVHLADALLRQDRLDDALTELDAALAFKPGEAEAHYRRGVVLDRLERYDDAAQAFRAAIDLLPGEVRYHQSLGFTLETLGRRTEAIKCFKRALELERPREDAAGFANN
jgi:tetratricopeptide (TPR) repeat protein